MIVDLSQEIRNSECSIDLFKLIESIDGHPFVTNLFEIHIYLSNYLHSIQRQLTDLIGSRHLNEIERNDDIQLKH